MAKHQRSQAVPPPTTNGAASAERYDQLQSQQTIEKDEKHPPQLGADRETLFQSFLEWYRDRSLFGQ